MTNKTLTEKRKRDHTQKLKITRMVSKFADGLRRPEDVRALNTQIQMAAFEEIKQKVLYGEPFDTELHGELRGTSPIEPAVQVVRKFHTAKTN